MHTHENLSPSNGEAPVEPETVSAQKKYEPEDFSQLAINRGQRRINYLLTAVDEKTYLALRQVEDAIQKLASCSQVNLKALHDSITEVDEARKVVAGEVPPGCDPWPN